MTREQERHFFENYMIIPNVQIAKNLGINVSRLTSFLKKQTAVDLLNNCKYFKHGASDNNNVRK
jgi:hypothetical protein